MKTALRASLPVLFSVLAFGASAPLAFAATTIYVDPAGSNTDGLTPATAFTTIQSAVNAATTSDDTINIDATYDGTENVTVSQAVKIMADSGAKLAGHITISADDVTVDGLDITNPTGNVGIVATDHSNLIITNNTIHDIGTTLTSGSAQAIEIVSNMANVSNLDIEHNIISDVGNAGLLHTSGGDGSAKGIYLGNSTGSNAFSTVTVSNNNISSVFSSPLGWKVNPDHSGGGGAYGILVNHTTSGLTVANNTIGTLEGLWSHAIGLEGNTPSAVVTGNTISNLVDHKTPSDAVGINIEDNNGGLVAGTLVSGNTFSGVAWKVADKMSTGTILVNPAYTNKGDLVDAGNGIAYAIGVNATSTIQAGINSVASGGTVNVSAGTYNESVLISQPLTLKGAQAGVDARGRVAFESIIPAQSGGGSAISVAANNVTIDGFEIQGAGTAGLQTWGINAAAGTPTTGVHITNTIFQNLYEGLHVQGPDTNVSSHMTVDKNEFFDDPSDIYAQDAGIWMASAPSDNLTIANNSFKNHDGGNPDLDYAAVNIDKSTNLTITSNSSQNDGSFLVLVNDTAVAVSRNTSSHQSGSTIFLALGNNGVTIQNNILDSGFRGVRLSTAFGTGLNQNIQVLNNTITNMVDAGVLVPVGTVSNQVVVTGNQITGSPTGVSSDETSFVVSAAQNWWGDASGPLATTTPVLNPTGTGSAAVGNVTYAPWYTNVAKTTLSDDTATDATYTSSTAGQVDMPAGATDVVLTDDTVMDLSAGLSGDAVKLNSGTPGTAVVLSNSNSNVAGITASIPDGTLITGPSGWDGKIVPPTATTTSGTAPSGFSVGGTVITIGSSAGTLTFDRAVKIVLTGVTGTVGYKPSGSDDWVAITTSCTSPTVPGILSGECSVPDGLGNTVIWTYHFTTFGGLNAIPTQTQSSGGGGGGSILSFSGSGGGTPNPLPGAVAVNTVATTPAATAAQGRVLGAAVYNFTKNLGMGSRGADVTALQQYLIANGFSLPAGATGYYGAQTRAAVIAFQRARGIANTGTVGPLTRAELNKGVVATTEHATSLTSGQASAILGLLQAFNADASVIANVKAALGL